MLITIQKAVISDAEKLTEIMKKTFDEEARRWLLNQEILDYNIQPPGYSSVEMTKYMIEELVYYKIIYNKDIVGGIIVTTTAILRLLIPLFLSLPPRFLGFLSKVLLPFRDSLKKVSTIPFNI